MVLILLVMPIIISQKTIFFSHASNSLFSNCTLIPQGLTRYEIEHLSQSGKIRWCSSSTSNVALQGYGFYEGCDLYLGQQCLDR